MYELVSAGQTNRWQQILDLFNITDIYYSCEYLISALKLDPGEAILFYYLDEAGEGEIAYPFIKRQLKEEEAVYYDITSPFGYGGPLFKVIGDGTKLASSFRAAFSVYCKAEKIVAEFIRFHPLMRNAEFFKDELKLISVYDTSTLALAKTSEDNGHTEKAAESMDRKSGYVIKKLGTVKHMFDFLVLYYSTIRQNEETDSYYFFTNDYFESLVSALGPNLHLFGAYKDNKLLTASYLLAKDEVIYHHLSGNLEEANKSEVQAEMLAAIGEWGAENNFRYFHITGNQAPYFKSTLTASEESNNISQAIYFIARHVHDPDIFKTLQPLEESELIKRYGNV